MAEQSATSYDEVPYDGVPRYSTHPDCLATMATLTGLQPAPVDACRVLELGCGTGANLIPMAATLPGSRFVGIDLSSRQIDMGRQVASQLGLTNLDLRTANILDVKEDFGPFDYIIAHGVYSWVPEEVRDKILAVCAERLTPHGIAYISYNAYPGWHLRGMAREMIVYHARRFKEPGVQVEKARAFLAFLQNSVMDQQGPLKHVLQEEVKYLARFDDYYVFHEHLEGINHPVYFWQFVEHAQRHGLQYLGESENHSQIDRLPPEIAKTMRAMADDLIHLEQYYDYLSNRTFRCTLLCRTEAPISRQVAGERVQGMLLSACMQPTAPRPDIAAPTQEEFRHLNGSKLSTNVPLLKAALIVLGDVWPAPLSFEELTSRAAARLGLPAGEIAAKRQQLAQHLLRFFLGNFVGIHVHMPAFCTEASAKPLAWPLARLQANDRYVSNVRHIPCTFEPFDRLLLPLLDGTRDRAALKQALRDHLNRTKIEKPDRASLDDHIDASLFRFAKSALLVG